MTVRTPARLHAVGGLGMLAGKPGVSDALVKLATDADAEVRAQVAKMFAKVPAPLAVVLKLLADPEPRVKASAAIAVASATVAEALRSTPAGEQAKLAPLFDVLLANNDADAYLRQAAAEGLVRATEQPCDLLNAWKNAGAKYDTPAVRLGLVLALRKLQCRRLGEFLNDVDRGADHGDDCVRL